MFIVGIYILILFRIIVYIVIVVFCCLYDDCYVLFLVFGVEEDFLWS